MKLILVLVIVVVITIKISYQELSHEQKEKISKYKEDCIADTKVNPELIERANKGDFVDDENLKCFAKCFYQKASFVDEDGNLLVEAIKAKIPAEHRERALRVIEKCAELKGADSCETIYLVHKCYFESVRKSQSTD